MSCCPLCGGAIARDVIWVLRDRGVIGRGDAMCELSGKEFELFMRLFDLRPRVVKQDALLQWLYQLSDEEPEIKIIDVFICKIRKKLKPLGITITTHWGNGYSILLKPDQQVLVTADAAPPTPDGAG